MAEPTIEELEEELKEAGEVNLDPPQIGDPQFKHIFPILGSNAFATISILKFLNMEDLTQCAQVNKFALYFISKDKNLDQITDWNLSAQEHDTLHKYIKEFFEDPPDDAIELD